MTLAWLRLSCHQTDNYSFSTDTAVAFITAKTLSPFLRFIRFTEPVVIIGVTIPARGSAIRCFTIHAASCCLLVADFSLF